MPEGPEIRRAADRVAEALQGKTVVRISVGLEHLKPCIPQLTGRRVVSVTTRGKAMLTRFDNELTIYSHNQLYGRWYTGEADLQPDTRRQLRLALITQDSAALLYSASTIELLNDRQIREHSFLNKLGPDVLSEATDQKQVLERLRHPDYCHKRLGYLLTDQSFLAGLGNYLRCEILFVCGLHPALRPVDCTPQQLTQLADTLIALPRQAYHTAGITRELTAAKKAMATGASFEQSRFYLFRRDGLPCYRCGERIVKTQNSGQACYLCLRCQSAAKP